MIDIAGLTLLTIGEIMAATNITRHTVISAAESAGFEVKKIGGRYFLPASALAGMFGITASQAEAIVETIRKGAA